MPRRRERRSGVPGHNEWRRSGHRLVRKRRHTDRRDGRPGGKVTTATYDGTGNVLTTTTAAGTTTDGYDKDNHLTSITYSNTASGYAQPANVTYTYDADGNRTSMADGTGTTHYTVNGFGELASDTNGAGSTVSYGYDADGEVTSITYPNGKPVSYS